MREYRLSLSQEEYAVADEKPKEETKEEQVLPLTSEEFGSALADLIERARAAGMRPLQIMAATYMKQSIAMVDGLLAALEGGGKEKGVGKKKSP